MVDRMTGRIVLSLFFFLAMSSGFAQTPSGAAKDSSVSVQAKSTADEDLNLDEGDNALAPSTPKAAAKPAAPTSAPEKPALAKSAESTPAPAATPVAAKVASADSSQSKAVSKPAAPVSAPAAPAAKTVVKKAQDEDLILEGGEDDLLDMSKIAAKKAAEAKKLAADSARKASSSAPNAQAAVPPTARDTTNKIPTPATPTAAADSTSKIPSPATAAAASPVTPMVVENERSVNFAKNLKEYRSPKLAMLMSLILPGSGQVYAGSGLAAAGFALVEAGIITGGMVLANKATQAKKKAHAFADTAYSADRFQKYDSTLYSWVKSHVVNRGSVDGNGVAIPDSVIQNQLYYQTIYTSKDEVPQFMGDSRAKSDNFYNTINGGAATPYINGWKDANPGPDSFSVANGWHVDSSLGTGSANSAYLLYQKNTPGDTAYFYGHSSYANTYGGMVKTSLDWSNRSRNVFFTLLINHIASAIIAGIQAQHHNDELLGRQTYLDHLDLQMDYVNTGSETVPAYYLAVKF